ncbi:MAG: DUF1249 domain-containing protein [Saprospiraceae bacterium]
MKHVFEKIYEKINRLVPNLDKIEPGEAVKLKADGFMDLHVDVLWRDADKTTIAMAHYFKQNGDMVPDPDMEIAIYPKLKMAEALSYQDTFGYRQVYPEPGMVAPKAKQELNSFLNTWLNNLKVQGHQLEVQEKQGRGV